MRKQICIFFLACCFFFSYHAQAYTQHTADSAETKYAKPHFMSLKGNQITVHSGPGKRYPIAWIYNNQSGLPVKVTEVFEHWHHITDYSQQSGWVHKSALIEKKNAVILPSFLKNREELLLLREKIQMEQSDAHILVATYASEHSKKVKGFFECFVIVTILTCHQERCKVTANGYKSWIKRGDLWGLLEDERF